MRRPPPPAGHDAPLPEGTGPSLCRFWLRLSAGLAVALGFIMTAFLLADRLCPTTRGGITGRSLLLLAGCTAGLGGLTLCMGLGRWQKIQQLAARYRSLHSWIGITTGSLLAMGFLAGTLTLFAAPLQQWSLPPLPPQLAAPLPLDNIPLPAGNGQRILSPSRSQTETGVDARPAHYRLELTSPMTARFSLVTGPELPLGLPAPRLIPGRAIATDALPCSTSTSSAPSTRQGSGPWGDDRAAPAQPESTPKSIPASTPEFTSGKSPPAACSRLRLSPVPSFIGGLHRRMGLPLPEEWAMPFVGLLCLFYGLALLSGVILMLPGIWRTLMTVRLQGHARRFWLDMHSLLGLCSLPFHLVIALTTALFAFFPLLASLEGDRPANPHDMGPPSITHNAPQPGPGPAIARSHLPDGRQNTFQSAPRNTPENTPGGMLHGRDDTSPMPYPPLIPVQSPLHPLADKSEASPRMPTGIMAGISGKTIPLPAALLAPAQALTRLHQLAPEFRPLTLDYMTGGHTPTGQAERILLHAPLYNADDPAPLQPDNQPVLLAVGTDTHGGPLIGRDRASALLDARSGRMLASEDLPGRQGLLRQILTWSLALHFGSFGGEFVRWLYVGLGLCGVVFFHTANQLWLNSHRRRTAGQKVVDTPATLWLGRLSEGSLLGCLLGSCALITLSPALVHLHNLAGSMAGASPLLPSATLPDPATSTAWQHVNLVYYGLFAATIITRCLLAPRLCRSLILVLSGGCLTSAVIMALFRHAVLLNTGTLSLSLALGLANLCLWGGAFALACPRRSA